MKIKDNSGGFWTEMLLSRKSPALVLAQNLLPDKTLLRVIGKEAISSVKGGVKHAIVAQTRHGKLNFHAFGDGSYPNGIQKRRSPDGTPYVPLKQSTMNHRAYKEGMGYIDVNRGPAYILRETSQHLMEGLRILEMYSGETVGRVKIGYIGEDALIAEIQNRGLAVASDWFDRGLRVAKIPAREFLGFQEEFEKVFFDILETVFDGKN